ncbi:DUF6519 domain-containing protein [Geodermatophilus sp. URMC 62]|uniref:DUF6519 domain-containing protein n=1 Tax=Geodermatophilus sp. URMC 62 TaxID=3423414 RepID=UPI00406C7B05
MAGDRTRYTFQPARGFSGVHHQQGRVSLDSDHNEFEEILDRRDRAETYDTVGAGVVPATTPTGFEIGVASSGELTIGIGRAYVDGVLAECFGDLGTAATNGYDPHLGNVVGSGPVRYAEQPFAYASGFPSISPTAGHVNLLYLDVWQRDVTVREDPRLLDPALGGPDTTTRVQTAWQVKALANVTASGCTAPLAAWDELVAPPTARLTGTTTPAPPAVGPCTVPPQAGYTGLENRLYRIQIQTSGALGDTPKPQFTWSRDNASLTASVLSITAVSATESVIEVDSTGRDSWMRFETGQHIELLDDAVEFAMRETGRGGELVKILDVEHATRRIRVDGDLSVFSVVQDRNPRIRRWDTEHPDDEALLDVRNGVPTPLEFGISVQFGNADTDTVRAGDYWVFAARTAEGTIDALVDEPPRGILHHYTRLALVTSGPTPSVEDCRTSWPQPCGGDSCGCDACVTVESHDSGSLTIQDAVDQVTAAGGGTVCLGPGSYRLGTGVVIEEALSLRFRGAGNRTVLRLTGDGPALSVQGSVDVVVRDLAIVAEREAEFGQHAVVLSDVAAVTLERLTVVEDPTALLQFIDGGSPDRSHGAAVALRGLVIRTTVTGCLLAGGAGLAALPSTGKAVDDHLVTADLVCDDDVLVGTRIGILLGDRPDTSTLVHLDRTMVTANSLYGCAEAGLVLAGEVVAGRAIIRDNTLATMGDGIVLATDRTTVEGNTGTRLPGERAKGGDRGIVLTRGGTGQLRDVRIAGNAVSGYSGYGVAIDADVEHLTVVGNTVAQCGGGVVMSFESSARDVRVMDNAIEDVARTGGTEAYSVGVALVRATDGQIVGNRVTGVGLEDRENTWRLGIVTVACESVRVNGNVVGDVGPPESPAFTAGIASTPWFARLDVLDNAVRQREEEQAAEVFWAALLVANLEEAPWGEHVVRGSRSIFWLSRSSIRSVRTREQTASLGVRGNVLESAGVNPTAAVSEVDILSFDENRCWQRTSPKPSVVDLHAGSIALTSNHVRGPRDDEAVAIAAELFDISINQEPAITAIGNITNGSITVNGGSLSPPWDALNIRLS